MAGDKKPVLTVDLRYFEGGPVIEKISRVSRPGLRVYKNAGQIPGQGRPWCDDRVHQPGHSFRSRSAQANVGGELICEVSNGSGVDGFRCSNV